MELTREHFRAIIVYNFRRGLSRENTMLKHEFRKGPPNTAVVPENIDAVHDLILQDRLKLAPF